MTGPAVSTDVLVCLVLQRLGAVVDGSSGVSRAGSLLERSQRRLSTAHTGEDNRHTPHNHYLLPVTGWLVVAVQEYGGRESDITIMPWRNHLSLVTAFSEFLKVM
jgi:hypothetical protein